MALGERKISFSLDSVLSAIIQDGDVQELWEIVSHRKGDFDINQKNHVGLTALHHAVLSNNLDAVKMLLTEGSDIDAQDINGFSPLHTASACGFLQISSLLIVFGADVFLQTKQAEMPIDVAKDLAICRLLADEMYPLIHREIYWYSFLLSKLFHLWVLSIRFVEIILKYIRSWWKTRRTVDECNNSTVIKEVFNGDFMDNNCKSDQKVVKLE